MKEKNGNGKLDLSHKEKKQNNIAQMIKRIKQPSHPQCPLCPHVIDDDDDDDIYDGDHDGDEHDEVFS